MSSRSRLVVALVLAGCTGSAELQFPGEGPAVSLDGKAEVGVSGMRRLSRVELDATLSDLLLEKSTAAQTLLSADPANPYDNDYRAQIASSALIEAAERIATDAAVRLQGDAARQQQLLGCTPTGANDSGCLRTFVERFGRRALRRPLAEDEITHFLTVQSFALEANDFFVGVKLVVQTLLQHPEFLYRVELGTPVAGREGVFQLSQFELASRLSYFVWGTMPPEWLLDQAQSSGLASTAQIRLAAARLLDDTRARGRIERFHALWFGYHQLPHAQALTDAMITESSALVDRVVFDTKGSDYFDLFRSSDTYVNALLATQYGLPAPASGYAWVPYGSSPRKGLLGHGAFLSQGTKFSDSSPTQRGKFIRNRLFCQEFGPPPPGVNVDQPPTSTTSSNCKIDRYSSHGSGGCATCHGQLDPVGFGLENYDREGKFRTHDDGHPECTIAGDGVLTGSTGDGKFNGQPGLTDLMLGSGQMEACTVKQMFRFAMGRREEPLDAALIENLSGDFSKKNRNFSELVLDLVSDATFAFRKDE